MRGKKIRKCLKTRVRNERKNKIADFKRLLEHRRHSLVNREKYKKLKRLYFVAVT